MNYQSIRAALEGPLIATYNALSPAVPVYFDNVFNYDTDAVDEFVHVNIQFGLTTEPTLTTSNDFVRGVIVVRIHTQKGKGASRNQTLVDRAFTVFQTLNNTAKPSTGVYVRVGSIQGPSFSPAFDGQVPDQQSRRAFMPFFSSRIEAPFQATVLS
jgi:hypothetical protein